MKISLWSIAFWVFLQTAGSAHPGGRHDHAGITVSPSHQSSVAFEIAHNGRTVHNSAILVGETNTTTQPLQTSAVYGRNSVANVYAIVIDPQVVRVTVEAQSGFVGARFALDATSRSYGVWEYPWKLSLSNENVQFSLAGIGLEEGVNWSNARAPFFLTSEGYAVYIDTLSMGYFDFSSPGTASFSFNTSTLTYYVIVPADEHGYKSILEAYAKLSNTAEVPPDSAYGPVFWSDNFEQDFHSGVSNAQENYFDVVNHLQQLQIHASAMFADRPYGTGNMSFGNFDFDPVYYPSPREFVANLTSSGFDFQVWVANRAFVDTELYNTSKQYDWLFPSIDPTKVAGVALNLSIPEAYAYFKDHLSVFPSLGVKGFKIDRGEEGEMPEYEQNVQMTLFENLCHEVMEDRWGDDYYNFARSIVDRSRSTTGVWNGDAHSNYSGLAYSVASGIRAGLLGFATWGSDTGGYIREADDPEEELWARWMWFSAFSPVYEIMIGTNHTPWYPPYSQQLVNVLKTTTDLHYDLLPYIRSYTHQAHTQGLPIIRAAFLEAPRDPMTYNLTDEYFFGQELLVAPIVTKGGIRSVYFPLGHTYINYFDTSERYIGGTTAHFSLEVTTIPAFVHAGAIIPRGDIVRANNRWTPNWQPTLRIELYPSASHPLSTFSYYNPDMNGTITISMIYTPHSRCTTVVYGSLGHAGELVVLGKGSKQTAKLDPAGGRVTFNAIESLFDD